MFIKNKNISRKQNIFFYIFHKTMTSKTGYESVLQFCYDQHKMIWYEPTVIATIK